MFLLFHLVFNYINFFRFYSGFRSKLLVVGNNALNSSVVNSALKLLILYLFVWKWPQGAIFNFVSNHANIFILRLNIVFVFFKIAAVNKFYIINSLFSQTLIKQIQLRKKKKTWSVTCNQTSFYQGWTTISACPKQLYAFAARIPRTARQHQFSARGKETLLTQWQPILPMSTEAVKSSRVWFI